ncbi:hypothetical protein C8J56DRAFT_987952 [Mycena floridula]|nr:hypothetical protein C8J56DRAFT_987952 [Mycena floridula]
MLSHSSFLLSSTFPMGSSSPEWSIRPLYRKSPLPSTPLRWRWLSALGMLFFLLSQATALTISVPRHIFSLHDDVVCIWNTTTQSDPEGFTLWWGIQSLSVQRDSKTGGVADLSAFNVAGSVTLYARTGDSKSAILAETTFQVGAPNEGKPPTSSMHLSSSVDPLPSTSSTSDKATSGPSTSSAGSDSSVPSSVVVTSETSTFATTASSSADSNSPMTFPATSSSAVASIGIPALSTSTSTVSANAPSSESGISEHHSNTAQIVGAVVGALIGISLIIIGIILLRRYRRNRKPVPIFDRERMVRGPNSYSSVLVPVIEPNSYTPEPSSIPKRNTYATLLDALKPEEPYPPEDYAGLPEMGYSTTDPGQLSPLREKYGSDE